MQSIEFRLNDLASRLIARLTDDLPNKFEQCSFAVGGAETAFLKRKYSSWLQVL